MCSAEAGSASRADRQVAGEANTSTGLPAAASDVVTKIRAIFCSVASVLNAPATDMSTVNWYQSRQRAASAGFFDCEIATPIS